VSTEEKAIDERLRTFGVPPLSSQEESLNLRLEALRKSERDIHLDITTSAHVAQEKRRVKDALSALR
jgi:hypothetical protein